MVNIRCKALNTTQLRKWQLSLLVLFGIIGSVVFLILEYIRLEVKYMFPGYFSSPSTMTFVSVFFITLGALLIAVIMLPLGSVLSKDFNFELSKETIRIEYKDKTIEVNKKDIDKFLFSNRGDYAKIIIYTNDKKYKYHIGLAYLKLSDKKKENTIVSDNITMYKSDHIRMYNSYIIL